MKRNNLATILAVLLLFAALLGLCACGTETNAPESSSVTAGKTTEPAGTTAEPTGTAADTGNVAQTTGKPAETEGPLSPADMSFSVLKKNFDAGNYLTTEHGGNVFFIYGTLTIEDNAVTLTPDSPISAKNAKGETVTVSKIGYYNNYWGATAKENIAKKPKNNSSVGQLVEAGGKYYIGSFGTEKFDPTLSEEGWHILPKTMYQLKDAEGTNRQYQLQGTLELQTVDGIQVIVLKLKEAIQGIVGTHENKKEISATEVRFLTEDAEKLIEDAKKNASMALECQAVSMGGVCFVGNISAQKILPAETTRNPAIPEQPYERLLVSYLGLKMSEIKKIFGEPTRLGGWDGPGDTYWYETADTLLIFGPDACSPENDQTVGSIDLISNTQKNVPVTARLVAYCSFDTALVALKQDGYTCETSSNVEYPDYSYTIVATKGDVRIVLNWANQAKSKCPTAVMVMAE